MAARNENGDPLFCELGPTTFLFCFFAVVVVVGDERKLPTKSMAHLYNDRSKHRGARLDFTPTFPAFLPNDKRGGHRKHNRAHRLLPDVTTARNYSSDTMLTYDSQGYIYNTMSEMSNMQPSVGTTIATEEIEFEYPEDEDGDGGELDDEAGGDNDDDDCAEDGEDGSDDGDEATEDSDEGGDATTNYALVTAAEAIYPVKPSLAMQQHHAHLHALKKAAQQQHGSNIGTSSGQQPQPQQQQPQQPLLLSTNSSMSSRTASTWLNETTYASTSLLDNQDEDDSWSSASATTSVLLNDNYDHEHDEEDNNTHVGDRTTATSDVVDRDPTATYIESSTPINLVESFLDELAENESVQRFGNFLLGSTVCQSRYNSSDDDEEEEEEDDDDEGEGEGEGEDEYTFDEGGFEAYQRGRSRSPRMQQQPPSSLRSLQSMADSIFELRRRNSRAEPHGGTTRKKKGRKVFFAC
jgi:hypothetical protein